MSTDSQHSDNTANEHSSSAIFVDLSESELDALLDRIEQAKTYGLALSAGDYELLMGAVMMMANMQERLESNDLSVHKLRKLLGMVRSSEKLRDLKPAGDNKPCSEGGIGSSNRDKTDKKKRKAPKKKKPVNKPELHNHSAGGHRER